jgi:hypothetical protein
LAASFDEWNGNGEVSGNDCGGKGGGASKEARRGELQAMAENEKWGKGRGAAGWLRYRGSVRGKPCTQLHCKKSVEIKCV